LKERGYSGSYSSVYRFVRHLEPRTPDVTVRVETPPGEEAQVVIDQIQPDGKAAELLITHFPVKFVPHCVPPRQADSPMHGLSVLYHGLPTVAKDYAYINGVPERIVIDNLKAGIIRACWHEPLAQQSYRECAEHYGFLISPCRPRTPRHKGKVEKGGIHYVKRNFLGGREPTMVTQANRDVRRWALTVAGERVHGTTKERPLKRFALERKALRPLPDTPYDMAVWKEVKLHRDCHLVFDQAYYSAPFRLVGQKLWVRGGSREVQIFTQDYQLVATHPRAQRPGRRQTHTDHLPPYKVPGLLLTRDACRQQASEIGSATRKVIDGLLDHRPEDRLRTAGRLLRLGDRFGPQRLEAACARALRFDDPSYMTIKRILEQELDLEELPATELSPPALTFARPPAELVGHLAGGVSWK
jgi:hypothetical protein